MTRSSAPGFAAGMAVAKGDGPLCGGMDPFAGAVAQLDRRLEALACETPLSLEHLEKRALVRQGFKAARRWPLAEAPRSRGSAGSGALAAE